MNATDLVFLNHRFHSLAYLKRFMGGGGELTCRALHSYSGLLLSNIINKVISISLIILSPFIIIEFGPPMSPF